MRYRAFAIAVAACLTVTRSADAEDRGLAVLVGASEGDPIVLKISDELRALGFEVEVAPHGSDRARLRRRATRDDAVAVVLVEEREIEVRVVTAAQVHERRLERRAADPSTGALAVVEVIRGYLVPVERESERESADAAPVAPAPTPARSRGKRPSVSARLAGGFATAGSFPALGIATVGAAKHVGRLSIGVSALAAIPGADAWFGGLDVSVQFAPLGYRRPVSFAAGIGVTGLAIAYKEDAKKYNNDAAALPHVDVVVRAAITDRAFARVDGAFGVSIPSPDFKSKTGSDIQFGSSVVAATAGVEVAW